MPYFLRWLIALALVSAVLCRGGEGDMVRFYLSAFLALTLLLLAFDLTSRTREIETGWIACLFFPPILLCIIQELPLGWHHLWLTDDLSLLGMKNIGFGLSIVRGAASTCLLWMLALASCSVILATLFRGERIKSLANGLVLISGSHALLGLILVLGDVDWPTTAVSHARGSFVYTNHAAGFWAACLPIALITACAYGQWWRWSSVALLSLGILLSGSRGGIIVASIVCLPLIPSLLPKRRRWWWATGLFAGIGVWLMIIGLQDLGQRFGALQGKEGLTLNGRLIIWKAALPVILDAGPFGCGAGTTTEAYRRSGDSHFEPRIVDHLHSDPLEWWLEFGWVGVFAGLLGIAGTIWFLWPVRGTIPPPDQLRLLQRGAFLGFLILVLHSCGDFIFHSPGIDLLAVVLLTICAQCRRDPSTLPTRSSTTLRMGMALLALAICVAAVPAYRYERDNILARNAGSFTYQRLSNHLPINNSGPIEAALAQAPTTVSLATMQSWLWRNLPVQPEGRSSQLARARDALQLAALLSPGDARAWSERAALDAELGLPLEAAAAAHRALKWAPSWSELQITVLSLARTGNSLPDSDVRTIIQQLLMLDLEQPNWFFPLAARYLGDDLLSTQIASGKVRLQRSGLPWLAEHGRLVDWLQITRLLLEPPAILPIDCQIMAKPLYDDLPTRLVVPSSNEERRRIADLMSFCGIALPENLTTGLIADGKPWSQWKKPIDLLDAAERASLKLLLRSELHHDWARTWSERLTVVDRIVDGDWSPLSRESDPPLLYTLTGPSPPRPIPDAVKARCLLILERYQTPEWQRLTDHLRFSWLFVSHSGAHAFVSISSWTGIVIDGHWVGWIRGPVDVAPLVGAGLHRLVLINP
jgi:hypothetical protein